jgi:prevent-host-death family protein
MGTQAKSSTEVGVYQARGDLSGLIKRALAGERITITVHGEPAVELVPAVAENDDDRRRRAVAALAEFARQAKARIRPVSAKQLKAEMEAGRR